MRKIAPLTRALATGEKKRKAVSGIMLMMLLVGMLTLALNIQLVKAIEKIFITDDGSIYPPDAPISSVDNVTYTFTDDIYNTTIVVQRSNIIVDGNGYTLEGDGTSSGFSVRGKNNVTIKKTNILSFLDGLVLWESNCSRAVDNNITNIPRIGIYVEASFNTTVKGNNVFDVWIDNSNHTAISDNYIGHISILYSPGNSISGNTISLGLFISDSPGNIISYNYINHISIGRSPGNVISGNTGVSINIKGSHDNMISGNVISGNTGAGIDISDSPSNIITNNIINNNGNGIWLDNSSNSFIGNSTISKNQGHGIYVSKSSPTDLIGNYVINNRRGIYLYEYDYDTISDNHIENNTQYGIYLEYSSHNTLSYNHIANNTQGIFLYWSHYNTLTDNNITSSTMNGIEIVAFSHDNKIYHNNFVDNTNQIYILDPKGNTWNNGYPSGGNYWSDYTDVDCFSGPGQDTPGGDGIWDHPYVIDADNVDYYPLMPPYHDIAILNITFSKQEPAFNETIFIYVTVQNKGDFNETFDISVNYTRMLDPLIGTQTITLAPWESIMLNFTWTPTARDIYEIKAYTSTILNDVCPSDNTKTTYIIVVPPPGGGPGYYLSFPG